MSYHGAIGGLVITGRAHCVSFLLHTYCAHAASIGFEHSVCHVSLLTSFIHIESWSYVNDSNDFVNKAKNVKEIPRDALLVTADIV